MAIPHNVIVIDQRQQLSCQVAFLIALVALAFIVLCSLDSLMRRLASGKWQVAS
jgi:hypothetical protein